MRTLPRVTAETVAIVEEAIIDCGPDIIKVYLAVIQSENPLLADQIRKWVKTTGLDPVNALLGAVTIYQLLSVQAASDAV